MDGYKSLTEGQRSCSRSCRAPRAPRPRTSCRSRAPFRNQLRRGPDRGPLPFSGRIVRVDGDHRPRSAAARRAARAARADARRRSSASAAQLNAILEAVVEGVRARPRRTCRRPRTRSTSSTSGPRTSRGRRLPARRRWRTRPTREDGFFRVPPGRLARDRHPAARRAEEATRARCARKEVLERRALRRLPRRRSTSATRSCTATSTSARTTAARASRSRSRT